MFLKLLLVFGLTAVGGQTVVNRVFVRDHQKYMQDVIQEVIYKIEDIGWSNMKLPDLTFQIDQTVFQRNYTGTVTYKNGFLVSVNDVALSTASFNQIWTVVNGATRVDIRAQLRLTDASLGYDIEADLSDGIHHYTGVVTHPLLTFDFSVFYWPVTHEKTVTVSGSQPNSNIIINILPQDATSDALTTMFDIRSTEAGVQMWGPEVFEPFTTDTIHTQVEFPGLCYNCVLPTVFGNGDHFDAYSARR